MAAPTSMLRWQYSTMLDQFLLLQLHAEDPSCPCSLRGISSHELGEYCEPKHTRAILAMARETVPMETDAARIELLQDIVETGAPVLEEMEAKLCGKETIADALVWSREKRKPIETIVYGMCELKSGGSEIEHHSSEEYPVEKARAEIMEIIKTKEGLEVEDFKRVAGSYGMPVDTLIRLAIEDWGIEPAYPGAETYRLALPRHSSPEVGVILPPEEAEIPGFAEALERCVLHVKVDLPEWCTEAEWRKPLAERRPGCYNPYAVCRASLRPAHGLGVKGESSEGSEE